MCDFCRRMPTVGAVSKSTPVAGDTSRRYQSRYDSESTNTSLAMGCQMPRSGMRRGSWMTDSGRRSFSAISGTYLEATLRSIASRFSGEPPSQYWKVSMNARASLAFSLGRYLSTLGRARRSLSMPSSKVAPWGLFFFMKSPRPPLEVPAFFISKEPIFWRRITSGMEGKTMHASRSSRTGSTASTTLSASSCTKMREPMKMLASATSFLKASKFFSSRSSSRR
mmetsp:Transcript_3880/g.10924  ORF Transcript_3880/g.10924 Transcript_3880/m.10924 type:complete len:224 (+) Transcript_3880:3641-4312(+)